MKDIYIENEEISEFLFKKLISMGMVPTQDEVDVIGDILFDFLVHNEVIDEEDLD